MELTLWPRDRDKAELITDLSCYSEFSDGGYDLAAVCKAVERVLKENDDGNFDAICRLFNEEYWKHAGKTERKIFANTEKKPLELKIISGFEVQEDQNAENRLLQRLTELYTKLYRQVAETRSVFQKKTGKEYLDAFFEASKKVVFQPDSFNLGNNLFRESRLLKQLVSFAAIKKSGRIMHPVSENNIITSYTYSLLDPFAYDTTNRILESLKYLTAKSQIILECDGELLRGLRWEIFNNSVQSAFKRYISLNKYSYRIEMNRHTSELTAYPANELSSTEEIKPIRLFGKTAAYIRNRIVPDEEICEIKLCIIGHTEQSRNKKEGSITDFAAAVLNWYNLLPEVLCSGKRIGNKYGKKPKLMLKIINYINDADGPESNYQDCRTSFILNEGEHITECLIQRTSYEDAFSFDIDSLKSIIRNNDLIFLLDCPWLSTENYRIKESGNLKYYCYELQQKKRDFPPVEFRFADDISAFYERSTMNKLGRQYNRIMSTRSSNSGELIRAMRDRFVMRIQECVVNERNNAQDQLYSKELYIFCSESEGIEYSYISRHPLTREERYDGKRFTIIQFSQNSSRMLPATDKEELQFIFDLWSVLKYISVSYAYRNFRDEIKKIIPLNKEEPILYFELIRNILIHFSLEKKMKNIHICIRFGANFETILSKLGTNNAATRYAIWKLTNKLVKPLYQNGVFKQNHFYGDDAIKKGFLMNLYGAAQDVRSMLFYHLYKQAYSNKNFEQFKISVDDQMPSSKISSFLEKTKDAFLNRDFFMDKKIYDMLMDNLEYGTSESLNLSTMLAETEAIFGDHIQQKYGHRNIRLYYMMYIMKACEATDYTDTNLYSNILHAIR